MSESSEFRTVTNCTEELEVAFLKCDRNIIHFLYKEGFITQEMHQDILDTKSSKTDSEKSGELIAGIRNRVKLSVQSYHTLLQHLRQKGKYYESIVNILDEEYSRQHRIGRC